MHPAARNVPAGKPWLHDVSGHGAGWAFQEIAWKGLLKIVVQRPPP